MCTQQPLVRVPAGPRRLKAELRTAFSVVELMVAVSIMTLIVLVLYGVFDQVQKALRGNVAQVDVLEGGRAATELLTRELEQMRAVNAPNQPDLYIGLTALTNVQELLETNSFRTNVLQELFFASQFNKQWTGVGYRVLVSRTKNGKPTDFASEGVGTLTRFSTNLHESALATNILFNLVLNSNQTNHLVNYQRVTDGVVHFRVRAYDALGRLLTYTNTYPGARLFNDRGTRETGYFFTNSLPAALDIELGILEPQVVERWRGIPNPVVASNFLARQTGKVHLFHQHVPIRTAQ